MTDTGALYTWGSGIFGQLGLGDTESRFSPSLVSGLYPPFLSLVCVLYSCLLACTHTLASSHTVLYLRTHTLAFAPTYRLHSHMLPTCMLTCLHSHTLHACTHQPYTPPTCILDNTQAEAGIKRKLASSMLA